MEAPLDAAFPGIITRLPTDFHKTSTRLPLTGCIADGETIEEAVENVSDALRSWLATAKEFKDPVPAPSVGLSGKWVQRVPKSLHAKLAAKAEKEGVSLNTLVVSLIAEGLGRRAS